MVWRLLLLVASATAYILPTDVVPSHYELRVVYDVDPDTNFSFYGVVDILITATKSTPKIVLHSEDHIVNNNGIKLDGPGNLNVTGVNLDTSLSFLTLTLDESLQQGEEYTLTIPFRGNTKIGLEGAYISHYFDTSSQSKEYLLTTQFQATAARKAFPCFDEPLYKATFLIVIGHHQDFVATSNMPHEKSTNDNILEPFWPWKQIEKTFKKKQSQFVFDYFEKSVPMSTYLVAYVISKFTYVESSPQYSNTTFKIWARKDSIGQTAYAANFGPRILSFYEEFFNIPFPLPKQDMIAIPDFAAGAMENWGLIMYQEMALLYDPEESAKLNKEYIGQVIAHELAHQWFGNLVTMKWWSDLWLNEGFATFMESLGMTALEPKWALDKLYAVEHTQNVMYLDVLQSSHPIVMFLDDPRQIAEMFDDISYRKGSVIIRMMYMFLGEQVFREALHNYLKKYSYKNAEQDDLWRELTDVAKKYDGLARNISVKTVMDTWTTQIGFPLLTVTRSCGGCGHCSVTISQKRYLNWGANDTSNEAWWVPLTMTWTGEAGQVHMPMQWLVADREEHHFPLNIMKNEWFLLNPDMIAPYRINYDKTNWRLLTAVLMSGNMSSVPVLGRVQLLSDAFALAWNNQLEYSTALQLTKYLHRETEYLPISTAMSALASIDDALKLTADYGVYHEFVQTFMNDQYRRTGFKKSIQENDLNSVKMQKLTGQWACRMGVPGCEDDAIEMYRRWMEEADPDVHNPIPRDLRQAVTCVAIARGEEVHWLFALERLRRSNVPDTRHGLLSALACTREVWLLKQYLEWTVTASSELRRQDAMDVIAGVATSSIGFYIAKEFLYSRMKDIDQALGDQGDKLGNVFKILLDQFTTQRELDEFLEWYEGNKAYLQDAKTAITQAIEMARVNIDWMKRNRKLVVDHMKELSHDSRKQNVESSNAAPAFVSSFYFYCIVIVQMLYC